MNDEEKRAKFQKNKSLNAKRIKAPFVPAGERGNLDAVVSLRFSGYELSLLRKESKSRNIGLSALIRELVVEGMERKSNDLAVAIGEYESMHAQLSSMPFSSWIINPSYADKKVQLIVENSKQILSSTK